MKTEIPRWGWYNGMYFHDLERALRENPNQSISDFHGHFRNAHLNGICFTLENQGLAISLLYMLLVVPREMWESGPANGTSFEFKTKKVFSISPQIDDNWKFLRLMRNAIAHANFDMNESGEYTFWNTPAKGGEILKPKLHMVIYSYSSLRLGNTTSMKCHQGIMDPNKASLIFDVRNVGASSRPTHHSHA